jgi:hypothetical protein
MPYRHAQNSPLSSPGVHDRDQRGDGNGPLIAPRNAEDFNDDEIARANLNDQILHRTGRVANLTFPICRVNPH